LPFGGSVSALALNVAGFAGNPGPVNLFDADTLAPMLNINYRNHHISFGITQPLTATVTSSSIHVRGNLSLLTVPAGLGPMHDVDLSLFAGGAVLDMYLDPAVFSLVPSMEGGQLDILATSVPGAITWWITLGGNNDGTNVPEPMALPLFGLVAVAGAWLARRSRARPAGALGRPG
jgi:hypothetical protein